MSSAYIAGWWPLAQQAETGFPAPALENPELAPRRTVADGLARAVQLMLAGLLAEAGAHPSAPG